MKFLLKLILTPMVWMVDLFIWLCVGLISCTGFVFRLASGLLSLLGVAVLFTTSVPNGLILLAFAFLISPMGLPLLAVKVLEVLQRVTATLRGI